jgi:hypothetical protein
MPSGAFEERARVVANAWQAAAAGTAWQTGFVPLADLTIPPPSGFRDDGTKQAFISGWYAMRAVLPSGTPATGAVRFPDGATLTVPLVGAKDAYDALDKGDPPCPGDPKLPPGPGTDSGPSALPGDGSVGTAAPHNCVSLTVTGATLSTTTLPTSRGAATVPAWLFTIAGLPEPVARVAVAASAVTPVPSPSVPTAPQVSGLVSAQDLTGVDGNTLTYRLGVGACDTDITPLVYETDHVVVVAGSVTTPTEGACIAILKLHPVTVTLAKPLASRPVVDAATGRPLTLTVR